MVCHPLWHKVFWQPQSTYMILKGSNLHKSKDWLCKILSFNPFHSTRLLLRNSYWLFKFLFVQHYLSNSKINSPLLYQENWEALPWTILVLLGTHTLSITPQTSQILSSPYLSLVSCAKIALLTLWKAHYPGTLSSPSLSDLLTLFSTYTYDQKRTPSINALAPLATALLLSLFD